MHFVNAYATVLLVEDEPAHATLIAEALRGVVGRVDRAGTGAEALRALTVGRFDLVVLDIGLPDMSGLAVLTSMRERGDTTPVVCVTIDDAAQRRAEATRQGAADYIVKRPGYLAAVAAAAREVMGRRSRHTSGS